MTMNSATQNMEKLLAEAEELIQQINSDAIEAMQEEQRLQLEKHAQNLKEIKSDMRKKIEKKGTSKTNAGAEGVHEAILDIVKAMRGLKKYLS